MKNIKTPKQELNWTISNWIVCNRTLSGRCFIFLLFYSSAHSISILWRKVFRVCVHKTYKLLDKQSFIFVLKQFISSPFFNVLAFFSAAIFHTQTKYSFAGKNNFPDMSTILYFTQITFVLVSFMNLTIIFPVFSSQSPTFATPGFCYTIHASCSHILRTIITLNAREQHFLWFLLLFVVLFPFGLCLLVFGPWIWLIGESLMACTRACCKF